MDATQPLSGGGYEAFYRHFDSPLMRQIRREAYGEDIGQHSWVGADDLRDDIRRLGLSASSRLLDLGCGACGPLTFVCVTTGCAGTGLDVNPAAIDAGRARARELAVESRLSLREADLNEPLPCETGSFDAVMALDVVLHVRDRDRLYREIARVLTPGGRVLITDAGVVTGAVSNDDIRRRSANGYTEFVPPGFNETLLASAGFEIVAGENRTASVLRNAGGRLTAMQNHRIALEALLGADEIRRQLEYLATATELAQRGAVSRMMYLATRR